MANAKETEESEEVHVVIAHYAARGHEDLQRLCEQISGQDAGHPFHLLVVSNIDLSLDTSSTEKEQNQAVGLKVQADQLLGTMRKCLSSVALSRKSTSHASKHVLPSRIRSVRWAVRPNLGMNIGAWDFGWRLASTGGRSPAAKPERSISFLFLQDEVDIQRKDWVHGFVHAKQEIQLGKGAVPILLGESWNHRWEKPWSVLIGAFNEAASGSSLSDSMIQRAKLYFQLLEQWDVTAQQSAGHLRSLVLFSNLSTLKSIHGFRVGKDKEACVASEIAVSQAVAAQGGIVKQVSADPFFYLWHREWRKDGVSKAV